VSPVIESSSDLPSAVTASANVYERASLHINQDTPGQDLGARSVLIVSTSLAAPAFA
jgi:hypothetical protein